jgi:hypothetical protein
MFSHTSPCPVPVPASLDRSHQQHEGDTHVISQNLLLFWGPSHAGFRVLAWSFDWERAQIASHIAGHHQSLYTRKCSCCKLYCMNEWVSALKIARWLNRTVYAVMLTTCCQAFSGSGQRPFQPSRLSCPCSSWEYAAYGGLQHQLLVQSDGRTACAGPQGSLPAFAGPCSRTNAARILDNAVVCWGPVMADQGIVVQQSTQAIRCGWRTAEPGSTNVAARLDAVELDCTLLAEAQTAAGLQMKEGSEVDPRTKGDFAAEEAQSPLCWYAERLADH